MVRPSPWEAAITEVPSVGALGSTRAVGAENYAIMTGWSLRGAPDSSEGQPLGSAAKKPVRRLHSDGRRRGYSIEGRGSHHPAGWHVTPSGVGALRGRNCGSRQSPCSGRLAFGFVAIVGRFCRPLPRDPDWSLRSWSSASAERPKKPGGK
jgi:hypothetical protein